MFRRVVVSGEIWPNSAPFVGSGSVDMVLTSEDKPSFGDPLAAATANFHSGSREPPEPREASPRADYLPGELTELPGEHRRDRKSTRAAAPCAVTESAANVRPTVRKPFLDLPFYPDVATRCVELTPSPPARLRRVCRITKLGRPTSHAASKLPLAPSPLALTMRVRSAVSCAGSTKFCSSSGTAHRSRARSRAST